MKKNKKKSFKALIVAVPVAIAALVGVFSTGNASNSSANNTAADNSDNYYLNSSGYSGSDNSSGYSESGNSSVSENNPDYYSSFDNDLALKDAIDELSVTDYTSYSYVTVNNNVPFFSEDDFNTDSFEYYSPLDKLGRCSTAYACIDKDMMPTEKRGSIGMIKPSGWHTVKYDCVDSGYLYNRCHLIGYQLTGQNANELNLITGTRYMNVDGMEPFESDVASYIKNTGGHVLYRVTPVFKEDNLLCDGVLMEAADLESNGSSLSFCIFAYNVQPGIYIDYATGESSEE